MATAETLQELFDPQEPLNSTKLLSLSGITREEALEVEEFWFDAPPARRTALLDQMLTLTEDNPEADFTEVLRLAMDDEDPILRISAIDGLWECNERWLLEKLIGYAKAEEDLEVRAAATLALGKFVLLGAFEEIRPDLAERVEETLFILLEDETQPLLIRRRAIEAISQGQNEALHDIIRDAYHSEEKELKLGALYAMGQACDEGWLPVLLAEMKSPDSAMRFEAARAAGELEDVRAIPSLIEMTNDSDAEIQGIAIEALGHIGGATAKEALRDLTTSSDLQVKEAAQDALEELTSGEDPLTFK